MSEAGTLLSDLDGGAPSDRDLVDSIFADLNQPSGNNPVVSHQQAPPPPAARMAMQTAPPMQSTYPTAADPAVPTAHMIGRDHPTEADFQRMMMAAQGPLPYNAMTPQMQPTVVQTVQQAPPPSYEEPKKNWQGQWIDELRLPIVVAICVFLVTLPAVNLLVAHYAPQLLTSGGNLTTAGMVARAAMGGAIFWVFHRVIAPLLSF